MIKDRKNRGELLWMAYFLSGMWAMMDDAGYYDYEDLTSERYKEIEYSRDCERYAFKCIEKILKLLLDGVDIHGVDIDEKSPFRTNREWWSQLQALGERDTLYRLLSRLEEWRCEYGYKEENTIK